VEQVLRGCGNVGPVLGGDQRHGLLGGEDCLIMPQGQLNFIEIGPNPGRDKPNFREIDLI